MVASWELGIPHKRRRGGKYEILPGRGGGRAKWERIGDGAYMWDEDEDGDGEGEVEGEEGEFEEDEEGYSSDENLGGDGWVGVDGDRVADGMRRRRAGRGEVAYEDRWEVDRDELLRRKVGSITLIYHLNKTNPYAIRHLPRLFDNLRKLTRIGSTQCYSVT